MTRNLAAMKSRAYLVPLSGHAVIAKLLRVVIESERLG